MNGATAQRMADPDAFLVWERAQSERHTYVRGEVFSMAGGSPRHSRLAARMIATLDEGLRGRPCDVHTSDLRLGLAGDHFAYADAVVVCRPVLLRPSTSDVVLNPKVVVEVLSRSTEGYDRGDKQAAYLALPSVEHLVLVSQREARVELYTRQPDDTFHFSVHGPGSLVALDRIAIRLSVDALYEGVMDLPGDEATA
ncbi:MAG: Uma2 family endonuclease [Polyangiaceae bacterium]